MQFHLYEFRSDKKKLRCVCGWERTLKTTAAAVVSKAFAEHCKKAAVKPS